MNTESHVSKNYLGMFLFLAVMFLAGGGGACIDRMADTDLFDLSSPPDCLYHPMSCGG